MASLHGVLRPVFKEGKSESCKASQAKLPERVPSATFCWSKQVTGQIRFKGKKGGIDSSSGWEEWQRVSSNFNLPHSLLAKASNGQAQGWWGGAMHSTHSREWILPGSNPDSHAGGEESMGLAVS